MPLQWRARFSTFNLPPFYRECIRVQALPFDHMSPCNTLVCCVTQNMTRGDPEQEIRNTVYQYLNQDDFLEIWRATGVLWTRILKARRVWVLCVTEIQRYGRWRGGEGNFRSVISREKASSVKYHVPYPLIVLFVCSLFVPRRRLMLVCRPMFHFLIPQDYTALWQIISFISSPKQPVFIFSW